MACLHPITILNRTKGYLSGVSGLTFKVPCGHCEECRRAKVDEWSIRAYAEMESFRKSRGFTLFPTLTYNDANLPYFYSNCTRQGYKIPCFDKDHIVLFMNSLRKHFERKGFTGIKYLICSEYGENTQRPHYHGLIHFPYGITVREAVGAIDYYWKYGMVGWSEIGKEVTSYEGCLYTAKYITKDISYETRRDLQSFLNKNNKDYALRYNQIKDYLPRHWQSKGYGESLVDVIKSSDDPILALKNGYRIPLTDKVIKYPAYIVQKLCYEYLEDGRRVLTDFGKQYRLDTFDQNIAESVSALHYLLSMDGLSSKLDDTIVSSLELFKGCKSVGDLHSWLDTYMEHYNFSLEDYAIYVKCFKGTVIPHDSSLEGYISRPMFEMYDYTGLYEAGKRLWTERMQLDLSLLDADDDNESLKSLDEWHMYSTLPAFRVFEEFGCYIRFINGIQKERATSYQKLQDRIIKKLKDLHNETRH